MRECYYGHGLSGQEDSLESIVSSLISKQGTPCTIDIQAGFMTYIILIDLLQYTSNLYNLNKHFSISRNDKTNISRGEGWDCFNRFHPATSLCLPHDRASSLIYVCHRNCCV